MKETERLNCARDRKFFRQVNEELKFISKHPVAILLLIK
jgi:hypothetical protein